MHECMLIFMYVCIFMCACMCLCVLYALKKIASSKSIVSAYVRMRMDEYACMYAYLHVCMHMHACERCGVHSKNLQALAHSHARKNKTQAHLLQTVSTAVSLGLLFVLSMRSFLSFVRTDPIGFPRLPHVAAVRTVFALARGRSGTSLLGNDRSGYILARNGSLCHFLGLWNDAHFLRGFEMKTRDKSRASCKQKTAEFDRSR